MAAWPSGKAEDCKFSTLSSNLSAALRKTSFYIETKKNCVSTEAVLFRTSVETQKHQVTHCLFQGEDPGIVSEARLEREGQDDMASIIKVQNSPIAELTQKAGNCDTGGSDRISKMLMG